MSYSHQNHTVSMTVAHNNHTKFKLNRMHHYDTRTLLRTLFGSIGPGVRILFYTSVKTISPTFIKINRVHPTVTCNIHIRFELNRMHRLDAIVFTHMYICTYSHTDIRSTGGRVVLRSKLVNGRCRAHFPVLLIDLAVRSFSWFSPKLS